MIDPILLTQDDFKPYRDISDNVDFARLEPWILEAEKQEMRSFLGQPLYLAMINDWDVPTLAFQTARFIDLWNGLDVADEYRFYGLKPAIIYYAYSRFLKNQKTNVTRFGVRNLENDVSAQEDATATRTRLGEAEAMAIGMQSNAETYINDNIDIYPEYTTQGGRANQKNIYINVRRTRYNRWGAMRWTADT